MRGTTGSPGYLALQPNDLSCGLKETKHQPHGPHVQISTVHEFEVWIIFGSFLDPLVSSEYIFSASSHEFPRKKSSSKFLKPFHPLRLTHRSALGRRISSFWANQTERNSSRGGILEVFSRKRRLRKFVGNVMDFYPLIMTIRYSYF